MPDGHTIDLAEGIPFVTCPVGLTGPEPVPRISRHNRRTLPARLHGSPCPSPAPLHPHPVSVPQAHRHIPDLVQHGQVISSYPSCDSFPASMQITALITPHDHMSLCMYCCQDPQPMPIWPALTDQQPTGSSAPSWVPAFKMLNVLTATDDMTDTFASHAAC